MNGFDRNRIRHNKERMERYSDEFYTSAEQVKDVIERVNINKDWRILCPFDTEESEFVKYLKFNGYNVTYLQDEEVSTDYNPENYDIIITNPPWKGFTKLYSEYFDRCTRFITVLSWSVIWNVEKKVGPMIKLRSFMKDKYRSKETCILFKPTNSDKIIGCFYLYKGFDEGNNIQPVKILKYEEVK